MSNTGQKRSGRPVDKHSAMTKARAIYSSLPNTANSRKESVHAFMTITDVDGNALSKNTAGAYYAVIARELGISKPNTR